MPVVRSNIVPLRHARPAVVAYVKSPVEWFVSNSGWIQGATGVVLVDTCGTEQATLDLVRDVRKYSPSADLPLTVVVTHAHGEHHNGVGVALRDGGIVLAAPGSVEAVKAGPQTYGDVFSYTQWGHLEAPDPAAVSTVTEPRRLDLGDSVVDVVPVPGVAHTAGDLVVFEPRSGVLFTGDLLFAGDTPMALHGSIPGWLEALDWLEETFPGARMLVPGHGPIGNPANGAIDALRCYLTWLLQATAHTGADFSELATVATHRWPEWRTPERHVGNLMRAHADQHGCLLNKDSAIDAVLRAAGGTIDLDGRLGSPAPANRMS